MCRAWSTPRCDGRSPTSTSIGGPHLYERPINEGLDSTLSVSIPNYRDWRDGSRAFAAMVLWRPWSFNLAGDDQAPERLRATIVTPNLFAALRLVPAAGRLLQDSDDPLDGRVAFISHGCGSAATAAIRPSSARRSA